MSLSRFALGQANPVATQLTGKLTVITGAGNNVVVLAGDSGSLLVDCGDPAHAQDVLRLAGNVKTVINTHWHLESTGANGAMAKAGSTNLVDVLHYAEAVTKKGFVFMDTPGYDPVAATGQVAGGANLVCFTTGRGSVFGCKPAPSIKLATNTPMYKRMEDDMDVNCGTILDGEETVQHCGERIFDLILKTA